MVIDFDDQDFSGFSQSPSLAQLARQR